MTQIVRIAAPTLIPGFNNIDDIVDMFPDDHLFGAHIYSAFSIIQATGLDESYIKDAMIFAVNNRRSNGKYPTRLVLTPAQQAILENAPGIIQDKIDLLPTVVLFNG